jgi:hypothetical protein
MVLLSLVVQTIFEYNQGLKSIGNTGTAFPGRQTVGRKEEAFIMSNQEDRWSFIPEKLKKLEN